MRWTVNTKNNKKQHVARGSATLSSWHLIAPPHRGQRLRAARVDSLTERRATFGVIEVTNGAIEATSVTIVDTTVTTVVIANILLRAAQ